MLARNARTDAKAPGPDLAARRVNENWRLDVLVNETPAVKSAERNREADGHAQELGQLERVPRKLSRTSPSGSSIRSIGRPADTPAPGVAPSRPAPAHPEVHRRARATSHLRARDVARRVRRGGPLTFPSATGQDKLVIFPWRFQVWRQLLIAKKPSRKSAIAEAQHSLG